VRPETVIRWHRRGWRLYRDRESGSGDRDSTPEVGALITRMAFENPT
jgi:hypothetical protein